MSFLDWFRTQPAHESASSGVIDNIVSKLEGFSEDKARRSAVLAFILSRVAHADMKLCDSEAEKVRELLQSLGELSADEADRVASLALEESSSSGGTANFPIVREFGEHATQSEKRKLLRCLFAVAAADGSISTVEANTLRQIGDELRLDRGEYLAIRSQFKDKLAVLQNKPKTS